MTSSAQIHQAARADLLDRAMRRIQRGMSLVEIAIVTAIILVVAIIGIPSINAYLIERKVPAVAQELQQFAARTIATSQGTHNVMTAFNNIQQAMLTSAMTNSSVVSVSGADVLHGIGASTGRIVVAAVDGGQGFSLTLDSVNAAACPSLASTMQSVASKISVNGTVVKNVDVSPPTLYSAAVAGSLCTSGDTNTFVFTIGNYNNYIS